MSEASSGRESIQIAVCSRTFSAHPRLRAALLERYPRVRFNEEGRSLRGDELARFLAGADKAIVALEPIDGTLLDRVPSLRVISKYGVGMDALDLPAMEARGVSLGWRGGVNRQAVAELTLCFALALLRRLPAGASGLREGRWVPATGRELGSVTFGVLGCGRIGRQVVKTLAPFGTRLLAHDLVDQADFYAAHDVRPVSLETLLAESDIVSLHVPLDASTRFILNADRLAAMKPGAMLINTARGHLVDEAALAEALRSGRLSGAAFDVFATEPTPLPALVQQPSFLGTPHVGGSTEEGIWACGLAAIDGLDDYGPATQVGR